MCVGRALSEPEREQPNERVRAFGTRTRARRKLSGGDKRTLSGHLLLLFPLGFLMMSNGNGGVVA